MVLCFGGSLLLSPASTPQARHGIQEVGGSIPLGSTPAILVASHSATSTAAPSSTLEFACSWDGSGAVARIGRTFHSGPRYSLARPYWRRDPSELGGAPVVVVEAAKDGGFLDPPADGR